MGTGICSRRQKGLLHTAFCLLALMVLASGAFLYNYIVEKARESEAQTVKFKQQQETLSAQLQVVYEHRSRLERSLQKERGEHKKTKEDFLVYKLEAQEALNKEKQDSMNRYGALNSQHNILKNQHVDLKKQLTDLQDTIVKLREESKLLRKAHQDVHSQLLSAQVQVDEFRQLKNALKKMPSFKDHDVDTNNQVLTSARKVFNVNEAPVLQNKKPEALLHIPGKTSLPTKKPRPSENQSPSKNNSVPASLNLLPPRPQTLNTSESHLIRVIRAVNNLPNDKKKEEKAVVPQNKVPQVQQNKVPQQKPQDKEQQPNKVPEKKDVPHPVVLNYPKPIVSSLTVNKPVPIQSWQDIVKKVNERKNEEDIDEKIGGEDENHGHIMDMKEVRHPSINLDGRGGRPAKPKNEAREEMERDAGMIDGKENLQSPKQHVLQEPLIPQDGADPAKDPNNQGEDEFEEAQIDERDFEEKTEGLKKTNPQISGKKNEGEVVAAMSQEEAEEHYQDDQEEDIQEHGGEELDNVEDLEQDQKKEMERDNAKTRRHEYYGLLT
ncbi:Golgi integral membrane protein 4-like isoform X2 [Pelobates fuscus]|uniref:Golgi integral membrane protein 4-like isoform X2 n=1 Tax=Pelobates fuscus TaxID=191477 RepID=UPI002FE44926